MRVPVRRLPDTRVSEQQQGYARAADPLNLSPITSAMEGLRDQLKDEQRSRQQFDLNKRLIKEVNGLQEDFIARQRNPEISPYDFAGTTNVAYTERHEALLSELDEEGFDRDLIDDLDLKLGSVRQDFFVKGLTHQLAALRDRAFNEADDFGVVASQQVGANPDSYATVRDMVRENVSSMPDLTEAEREAKTDELLGIIRDAGMKALAIQDPQFIIDTLDPQGLTAPYRPPAAVSGAPTVVNVEGLDTDRGAVAGTLAGGGLSPQVVAGFLGNFDVEGGYGGAQGDGGTASGIAQWRKERRDNFKAQFGKEPHAATKEEQAQFVLWELNNPAAAGMTVSQRDAILAAETVEEAAELIDKFYERSSGEHRSRRTEAALKYASIGRVGADMTGAMQLAPQVEEVDLPASEVEPQVELPSGEAVADFRTGHPLLDDLNGPERLQLLGWAREQQNKVNATRKAEMDVVIGNITAEALNNGGEIATALPSEADVLAVYGPVEGPQRWAQIQQSKDTGRAVVTFRTQSATDIQRGLDALEPTPGSPTYETELQIYQSAERAASALLTERDSDPAAYAMKYFPSVSEAAKRGTAEYYAELDRVYETLGVDARYAPVMSADVQEKLVEDYKIMTPSQRREFMRDNFSEMGEARFKRFVADMEGTTAQDDARIFALLRTYPGRTGEVANIYHQVLEGREIMAKDPARRPQVAAVNEQFRLVGLDAINNLNAEASRAIQESAIALYVQRGGHPTQIDTKMYKEALATALGGSMPADMTQGEVTDFTILPPKTSARQFENFIERQTFQSLTAMSVERRPPRYGDLKTPVPMEDIIDEGVFVMTSPGRYMIKMGSDGKPLMTSTGKPFLVNITPHGVRK